MKLAVGTQHSPGLSEPGSTGVAATRSAAALQPRSLAACSPPGLIKYRKGHRPIL